MASRHMGRTLLGLVMLVLASPAILLADPTITVQDRPIIPAMSAISWQAIIAGSIVVLVVQLTLNILGIGIGAAVVDPYNRKNPTQGASTGALVWIAVSGLVALFLGGWTAGRMANVSLADSMLHGMLVWGLASLVTVCLLTSSLSFLVGGMVRMLGEGASMAVQAGAAILPAAGNLAKEATEAVKEHLPEFDWNKIKTEAEKMLREAEKKKLVPENLANKTEHAVIEIKERAQKVMDDPLGADKEFGQLVSKIYSKVSDGISKEDREEVVKLVADRTGMKKEEVNQTVERWEKSYQDAKNQLKQAQAQLEQKAREAADATAKTVSQIALWTFASLLLGLVVATIGGRMGSPFTQV